MKPKHFQSLKPLFDYMQREYIDMQTQSSDRVQIISGYEGSGKSYLEMHLFDYWYSKILGLEITKQISDMFTHTNLEWGKALSFIERNKKKFYRLTHDEGVSLVYAKDATTSKNKSVNKGFKQIRGLSIYHSILIPQVHRIDKELREDRIRMLLFVYKKKDKRIVAVYPKKRLNSLIAELHRQIESVAKDIKGVPNVLDCKTKPLFTCEIPIYEGNLLKYYHAKKQNNMKEAVDSIAEVVGADTAPKEIKKLPKDARDKFIFEEYQQGKPMTKIAQRYSLAKSSVSMIVKKFKEDKGLTEEKLTNMLSNELV